MKKHILILGGEGNLGQFFSAFYRRNDNYFVTAYGRKNLDVCNEKEVSKMILCLRPDIIINCAAYNAVDDAESNFKEAMALNGYAVGYIAQAAENVGSTLVHFSTNYVFSGEDKEGYSEESPVQPLSAYGKSKALGEAELRKYTSNFYLIRTQWLYGGKATTGKRSFPEVVLGKIEGNQSLKFVNDEYGQPTYMGDVVKATDSLLNSSHPPAIYHITNSGVASWYDWAQAIVNEIGIDLSIEPCSSVDFIRKAVRPKYGILKNSRFEALPSWQDSLQSYLLNKTV